MYQRLTWIPEIRIVDQKLGVEWTPQMTRLTFWAQATELIVSLVLDKSHSLDTAAV